jgi:hypothetical protein
MSGLIRTSVSTDTTGVFGVEVLRERCVGSYVCARGLEQVQGGDGSIHPVRHGFDENL